MGSYYEHTITHDRELELLSNLKDFLPDLQIKKYRILSGGWNSNILLLNEEIVCRFPTTRYAKDKMLKEIELQKHMDSYPVTVPQYEYFHESEPMFGTYRYIEGVPLKNSKSRGRQMITDFSEVLQFNRAHSSEFNKLPYMDKYTPKEWQMKMEKLILSFQNELGPTIQQEFFDNLRDAMYKCLDSLAPEDMSFVHGDLSKDNVIISRNHRRVKGILDWADSGIGDVALDLAAIVDDVEELSTPGICNILSKMVHDVPIKRVMMYRSISPLYYAFFISRAKGREMLEHIYKHHTSQKLKRRYEQFRLYQSYRQKRFKI